MQLTPHQYCKKLDPISSSSSIREMSSFLFCSSSFIDLPLAPLILFTVALVETLVFDSGAEREGLAEILFTGGGEVRR